MTLSHCEKCEVNLNVHVLMWIFDALNSVQVRFDPESIVQKTVTMKGMDRAARLAMLPKHENFCVDLTESNV